MLLERVRERWPRLSLRDKVLVACILGACFVAMLGFCLWIAKPNYLPLYEDVPYGERMKMCTILSGARIPYMVKNTTVFVPSILLEKAYSLLQKRRKEEFKVFVDMNYLMPQRIGRDCPNSS